MGTHKFNCTFTRACHWFPPCAGLIQSIFSSPIYLRSILILSSHLYLSPRCPLTSHFPTKNLYCTYFIASLPCMLYVSPILLSLICFLSHTQSQRYSGIYSSWCLAGMLVNAGESSGGNNFRSNVLHCNMLVCNWCSNAIHVLYLPITHKKLSLCLSKHYATKAYGGVDV
jgi:hypothetical protein